NRPDVAERLLPLYFERLDQFAPEDRLLLELEARRGTIMGRLLTRLALIADGITGKQAPALTFRMADYAAFGWLFAHMFGKTSEWEGRLQRLEQAQGAFATEGDGMVEALRILLDREGSIGPIPVAELFKACREIADREGLLFPESAQAFGRRL